MAITQISQIRPELNFRELGGYVGADGRTIKHGVFYRSAALGEATEEELEFIRGLGLRYVLDLRSAEEAAAEYDADAEKQAKQLGLAGW